MLSRTLKLLELDKVLLCLSSKAVTEAGRLSCRNLRPFTEKKSVRDANSLLREAMLWQGENGFALSGFPDLAGVFAVLNEPEKTLDIEAFWGLQQVFVNAGKARELSTEVDDSRFPVFYEFCQKCLWPYKLSSAVNRCLDSAGNLRDNSSPTLKAVRADIRNLREQCTKKAQDVLQNGTLVHYLQDEFLTISSDRYVLALKANFKGRLQGIVHDYSQTGETCYFEPMFLMDLNNRLQGLKREERSEIKNILNYLTSLAYQEKEALIDLYNWAVDLDVLMAKCALGREMDGIALDISGRPRLSLLKARHPLLAFRDDFVQPVDIVLNDPQRILIISGGNSGGKTVALKTLGLCACMASCGLPIPVEEGSSLPFWDQFFVSMGDEQSLEESLSTFTAQIRHLRDFWPEIGPSSLVIMDEFGAGTSPSQGAALAQAVVDELAEKGAWVIAATHFPALKAYGLSRERARSASVIFDPETKKPLYRLAYDQVGASQALDVAREEGLPEDILRRAQEYLLLDGTEGQVFERLNNLALEKEKALEALRSQRVEFDREHKDKLRALEKEKKYLAEEIREKSREILRKWKKQKISRKQALKELSELRSAASPATKPEQEEKKFFSWKDMSPGESCIYLPWAKKGIIRDKDERKRLVKLDLGAVSMWVAPEDIAADDDSSGKEGKSPGYLGPQRVSAPMRVDLRGYRAEEAVAGLEKFMDRALLAGHLKLEIVHGKGTGALRKSVSEFLQNSPEVENFGPAPEDQGGDGVTVVDLR